jgi:hypothetical protein
LTSAASIFGCVALRTFVLDGEQDACPVEVDDVAKAY